jgi:hypothetical protein
MMSSTILSRASSKHLLTMLGELARGRPAGFVNVGIGITFLAIKEHHGQAHRNVERSRGHSRTKGRIGASGKGAFEGLNGKIPGLLKLEIGIDISRIDYACDVVLYSEFDSAESLAAYAVHPEHLRVRDELAGVRISRHQVDYI